MSAVQGRVLRVPTCRASIELQARRPLTPAEYEQFRAAVPDVGLAGARFDEASSIYPFLIPSPPQVVVLAETPRCVSLRVSYKRGLRVGVIADQELEEAYTSHPEAFLYVVGALQERPKGDKTFLDIRPRGWLVVEVGAESGEALPPEKGRSRGKETRKKRVN